MKKSHWAILILSYLVLGCAGAGDTFTVASYNIRSFSTMNRRKDVGGTIRALGRLQSDICGVQEVRKYDNENPSPLEVAGRQLAMDVRFCRTLRRSNFEYGIGTLSKFKTEPVAELKLPNKAKQEPRKAMVLKVNSPYGIFYFVNTHLAP